MPRTLSRFTIADGDDEDFILHIEDDAGETVEFTATYEQLDVIVEAIDDHLNEVSEELDEVDEGGGDDISSEDEDEDEDEQV